MKHFSFSCCQIKPADVKAKIAEFDENGDERLDFTEFVHLMRTLRSHSVLEEMFKKHAKGAKEMTVDQLISFFEIEQKEKIGKAEATEMIRQFSIGNPNPDVLTEVQFQLLLTSEENSAWDPNKVERHHDMTQPMSAYHIDSSHNTYLVGDQLKSDSSIEMYIRALRLGCRCVELDLWDGKNGEPIVYHGHTLTSKIMLVDILRVIKSLGFSTTPYPIILSLENHCSHKQQERVAQLLVEVFGDMLVPAPQGKLSKLPSPEALKNKVIVKGSAMSSTAKEDELQIDEEGETEEGLDAEAAAVVKDVKAKKGKGEHKSEKTVESLSKLTFLQASKFKEWSEPVNNWSANQMASFSEPRTFKILGEGDEGIANFRAYNAKVLSRIYPKVSVAVFCSLFFLALSLSFSVLQGTRIDSSNYNPILPWYMGCQIVALNYQTSSEAMWVNYAKFTENGRAGYNLQPAYASIPRNAPSNGERFSRPKSEFSKIRIRIHGARMLPQVSRVDILDPYVRVAIVDGESVEKVSSRVLFK